MSSSLQLRALAALLALTLPAFAEHHGIVKFVGLPVPGATVIATQGDKTFGAVSDEVGAYSFADLPDGTWTIQVEMQCFATIRKDVTVAAGAPGMDWELKLLPLAELLAAPVSVTAAPKPAEPIVRDGNKKPNYAKTPVASANTPSGFQKADVKASSNTAPKTAAEPAKSDAFAGDAADLAQRAADGFLINGTANNSASSPFGLPPAFGNSRKGPGSQYNGSIGFLADLSALDARSFSFTGQDTLKPSYTRFTGLVSLGGPLRIPHLLRRNGPNITIDYQWTRNSTAITQPGLVPTAAERTGDFSASPRVTAINPSSGSPFAGNRIPGNRISPQATALLALYPLPNFTGNARYNYQAAVIGATHQDNLQSRVNQGLGRKNSLTGNFAYQSTRSDNSSIFNFLDTTDTTGLNAGVNFRHSFAPRMYLNVGYTFSRLSTGVVPFFANRENISGAAGIKGNSQEAANWGPPNLSFSAGISSLSDAPPSVIHNQTNAVSIDGFWNRGRHNFSFGADYKRLQFNSLSQQDPRGSFGFTGTTTGSDLAGFLLGIPDTSAIAFGNADKYFRAASYDAYFTDDWRVAPGFTLNAGIRWEYGSPITELYGRLVNLDIARGYTAIAPVVAATPTGPLTGRRFDESLIAPVKHAFQPRIALSWRPFAAASTVIRAGYGVYYNTSVYVPIATQMAQQSPLSKSLRVQNTPEQPLTLADGFLASSATPNTFAVDPDLRVGYSQNWQLSIQRDLPGALVITGTYLGIKGTRGLQLFLPNTAPNGLNNPCGACPAGYVYLASNGNSTRESGSLQLRRRMRSGIQASVLYTYSKSIDNAAFGGRSQASSVIAQDWLNLDAERALSPFDQRHLAVIQGQYTTGVGLHGGALSSGWKASLLKDWTFVSQANAGSGLPLTPIFQAPVRGTGVTGSLRPDYTGAPLYNAPAGFFLNPAAYSAPVGHWGNAGRNSITGPSQFTLAAGFGRTFRVGDRVTADFRFDAQNALNHVTYTSWNTVFENAQFGLPVAANPMRSIQTTVRFRF